MSEIQIYLLISKYLKVYYFSKIGYILRRGLSFVCLIKL